MKYLLLLFLLPSLAQAAFFATGNQFVSDDGKLYRQFTTGTEFIWQEIVWGVFVKKSYADELSLLDQYKNYATTMAQFYEFPVAKFKAIISCESNWNPEAIGDKAKSVGILQWQERSFNYYSKKYNFDGKWRNPFDQMKIGAIVMGDIGSEKDWTHCSKFYTTGSWDFLKK